MGLLSDPEYGSVKWVRVLKKVHRPLCFLFYIGALVWFVLLGNREFNNETYFSENALLPGLVTNEFNGEQAAKQFLNEFQQELEDKYEDTDEMPVPWLVAKMSQLHLEVYTHNFTLNYPMGDGQVFKGTNVYGILRAARTPSLEALVVSAPYRSLGSHQKGTSAGIALMLAFAQFARPQKYWAKDIIFLITEHEQLGMQAWLEAYHGIQTNTETFYTSLGSFWRPGTSKLDISGWFKSDTNKCLNPGTLKGRSGSIQAAINLEFHTPKIKYIEVKVEGLNGQLPNLDLVNLVHKLCIKFRIHHSYKNSFSWLRILDKMQEWKNGVMNMLGMLVTQLPGVPNGNHGLFHRYGIEAVTLEGRDGSDPAGSPPRVNSLTPNNFYRLGVALESILRSLNNLLERFHQSYFFYILAATDRFVSIGQYMPSLCLLCVAMLARALSLWVSIQKDEKPEILREQKNKEKTIKEEKETEISVKEEKKKQNPAKEKAAPKKKVPGHKDLKGDVNINIMNIGTNYLLVHLIGYAVMNSPLLLSQIGSKYYDYPSELSVYIGFYLITIFLVFFTPTLPKLLYSNRLTYEEVTLVNILLLIELATVCLSVGMHNYPLGLVLGVVYTPLALTVGIVEKNAGMKSTLLLILKRAFAIALNPLIISAMSMMLYSFSLFPEEGVLGAITRGSEAHMQAVMFSIVDSMIYGNWLFNIAASVMLPIWILFWQILCINVETTDKKHVKND